MLKICNNKYLTNVKLHVNSTNIDDINEAFRKSDANWIHFPTFNIYRDVFDKLKADIRLMKEELGGLERSRQPKASHTSNLSLSSHPTPNCWQLSPRSILGTQLG